MNQSQREYVFVITYGRTGSTLLQGLLNSIPDVRVFGESEGSLRRLLGVREALVSSNKKLAKPQNDRAENPFFGASRYDPTTVTAEVRSLADRLLFDTLPNGEAVDCSMVGCKEIKHIFLPENDLADYLRQLKEAFDPHFLFLTRNIDDVLSSGWWAQNDPTHTRRQIEQFEETMHEFLGETDAKGMHVRYEDVIRDATTFGTIVEFLGKQLPDLEEVFSRVTARPHSYANRKITQLVRGAGNNRVQLLDKEWAKVNLAEFDLKIEATDDGHRISGMFLPRADVKPALSLHRSDEGDTFPVETGIETPELNQHFKFDPRSATAGFQQVFKATQLSGATHLDLLHDDLPFARVLLETDND